MKTKHLLASLLMIIGMAACNFSTTIIVTPGMKDIDADGGEFTVTITTDNEWTAKVDSAWVTLSSDNGFGDSKVDVTVAANNGTEPRSAIIEFKDIENTVRVIISQSAKVSTDDTPKQNPNAPVQVDVNAIKSTAEGGTFTVKATAASDVQYTISPNKAWVTIDKGMAKGNATLTVTVAATPANVYDATSAFITIKPINATSEDDYTYISITREGSTVPYFTISGGKKVVFAPGNLQYMASNKTWRFAPHQYDIIGKGNENISATYFDYIDLFGWGTSGNNDCFPYLYASDAIYGPKGETDIAGTDYDWGIYNSDKIINNPNKDYKWFTPSISDWSEIEHSKSITFATVCEVRGLLLFPDLYGTVDYTITKEDYTTNVINAEEWAELEMKGVVFLPAAGYREGNNLYSSNTVGMYQSSTAYGDTGTGHCDFSFSPYLSPNQIITEATYDLRYRGYSVRLVREVE